jgi:hypothetical protein
MKQMSQKEEKPFTSFLTVQRPAVEKEGGGLDLFDP